MIDWNLKTAFLPGIKEKIQQNPSARFFISEFPNGPMLLLTEPGLLKEFLQNQDHYVKLF